MIRPLRRCLVLLSLSAGLVGCASLSQPLRDEAAIQSIRKVAITCFSVYQEEPVQLGVSLNKIGNLTADAGGSMIAQSSAHSLQMVQELAKTLNKNWKWQVMDVAKMTANAGYKKAFDKTMKGWQNKMPPGKNQTQYLVDHVMDWDSGRILRLSGRDELIQALGVDAIIVVRMDVGNRSTTIAGIGNRYPQASMNFQTFVVGKETPAWREFTQGDPTSEPVGWIGVFNKALMDTLAVETAKSAFSKLGQSSAR